MRFRELRSAMTDWLEVERVHLYQGRPPYIPVGRVDIRQTLRLKGPSQQDLPTLQGWVDCLVSGVPYKRNADREQVFFSSAVHKSRFMCIPHRKADFVPHSGTVGSQEYTDSQCNPYYQHQLIVMTIMTMMMIVSMAPTFHGAQIK